MNTTTTGRAIRSSLRAGQNNPYLAILTTPSRRYASRHASGGGEFAGRKGRKGFTLVEVIVVLVILAILAAIAIPALTGYIDKAEDKKYIAQARNAVVATRVVLDEAYADGSINKGLTGANADYLNEGAHKDDNSSTKIFNISLLAQINNGSLDWETYWKRATELIEGRGSKYGAWAVVFVAPKPSSYTLFDAPAFYYTYTPGSVAKGNPYIVVTHKLNLPDTVVDRTSLEFAATSGGITFNQDEGYKVHHIVR